MTVDLRLYALLDPQTAGGHSLGGLARMTAPAATLVQLRDKQGTTRAMIEEARTIRATLPPNVPLLINDRVDVALAALANGVHVGWDDIDAVEARRLLGPDAIIGLSLKSVEQANAAPIEFLDYVAVGGVFATTSKDNPTSPIGIVGFKTILAAVRARAPNMPVCAIAGINASNADDVIAAGADGVAVISVLSKARDPAKAARDLRAVVDAALGKRGV
ncbi:MAG: thiamine phosphate synthase [Pseudolabrys sp.]|nr:thiamine phosphate synthase [Pseudolabrys sp.]MBV9260702.1 thiamine phosphate synthase [Pseudolabrys sp.]